VGIGDVDADGRVDLAREKVDGALYRQVAPRSFQTTTGLLGPDTAVGGIALSDVDGDGRDDWVAIQGFHDCPDSNCVEVRISNGDGSFQVSTVPYTLASFPDRLVGGCDLDGDGLDDVAGLVEESLVMLTGATPRLSEIALGRAYGRLDLVDLDSDGTCEAVVLDPTDIATAYAVVVP